MPNYYSRLNLASSIFPFFTEAAGRTIMMPEQDENWDRYNAANTTQDKGVPQVFYMHNVVPIANGFQSIGYDTQLPGLAGHTDFDHAFPLFNSDLSRFIFVPAQGANYIYDANVGSWASVSPLTPGTVAENVLVTTAYVQGQSYIYYSGIGCFQYNDTSKTLTSVTLTGLNPANVLGVTQANGYMVAWTSNSIAWSSLTDPTNFTPNIQTGAGGGSVNDCKGAINFCLPISGGFLVYCTFNIVGAAYTGNSAFPYILLEITGSGGCSTPDNVGWQSNLSYHIASTTVGIQQITLGNPGSASNIMPEVSDFLAAQIFEDFNDTTQTFSSSYIGNQLYTNFTAVGDRYIVISYGAVQGLGFTHAIIFDMTLNRYGKLKQNHVGVFVYNNPSPYGAMTYAQLLNTPISSFGEVTTYGDFSTELPVADLPKKNLALLQEDGTVLLVDFSVGEATANGTFIIGKFQMQRSAVIKHHTTVVESVSASAVFSVALLPTFDGKDFAAAVPTITNKLESLTRTFAKKYTSVNFSLLIQGAFNLTSIVINYEKGGFR